MQLVVCYYLIVACFDFFVVCFFLVCLIAMVFKLYLPCLNAYVFVFGLALLVYGAVGGFSVLLLICCVEFAGLVCLVCISLGLRA